MDFNETAYKKFKVISAVFTEVIMNTIEPSNAVLWAIFNQFANKSLS